jgi:Ferritin-like domain
MTFRSIGQEGVSTTARRTFLRGAGLILAGAGALTALPALGAEAQDVTIMQGALALEHEGIAAYRLAGDSGLISPGTLKVALTFKGHHEQHRDSLAKLIAQAGGMPVQPKSDADYIKALDLGALKSEADVISFAANLEQGATNAYAGQVSAISDRKLVHLFTQLCSDEAVHWTTLNNALNRPIPAQAYLFG